MEKDKIVVDSTLCKGCGFCVKYCPKEAVALGEDINAYGYKFAVAQEGCIACGICALMCPDAAISVYKAEGGK